MKPLEFLEKLRYELQDINQKILRHKFIEELSQGKITIEKIKYLLEQQYYIASRDAKALALMYSRSEFPDNDFFLNLLNGHQEALRRLEQSFSILGIDKEKIKPNYKAIAYTHYFFNLAFFGSIAEQIIAILINFPIFIENLIKIGKILKEKYNLEISFFTQARWEREVEFLALKILEKYELHKDERIKEAARLIQEYELEFWDEMYFHI